VLSTTSCSILQIRNGLLQTYRKSLVGLDFGGTNIAFHRTGEVCMGRIKRLSWIAGLLTISVISGCDDGAKGPFAPSGPVTPPSATIQGIVNNSAAAKSPPISSAFRTAGAIGMTVTVVGLNVGTVADSQGRFTLSPVPPGPVRLQFTGAGVNALLDLESVAPGETLDIVVSVDGESAVLEAKSSSADDPSGNGDIDDPDDDTSDDADADDADDQEDDDADDVDDDDDDDR
jgi:hypothetical protein